ncbi:hypothetical protein NC653_015751 [Populus alba x Populus x berolinensis]|uniref:Uncharacterized protein n=1 Tax=Populus alba x Populus x berolinensis TaxID=444605 RepID=A0AAD6VYF7_9ROSI|nr:hypothetical protein NC653_015751 [Populus alba x Populus x berolinensis]
MPFTTASSMLRHRISSALRTRSGASSGRWTSPGHEEQPKGYLFNRTPLPPGQPRKWEDWELPCYITSFLTIVILGVGLNAKPDLTIETWAHQKALERLETEKLGLSGSADSEWTSSSVAGLLLPYKLAWPVAEHQPGYSCSQRRVCALAHLQ